MEGERVEIDADMVVTRPAGWDVDPRALATGVPPSIAAQMLARGDSAGAGVAGGEAMLPVEVFLGELERRGLRLERAVRSASPSAGRQSTAPSSSSSARFRSRPPA